MLGRQYTSAAQALQSFITFCNRTLGKPRTSRSLRGSRVPRFATRDAIWALQDLFQMDDHVGDEPFAGVNMANTDRVMYNPRRAEVLNLQSWSELWPRT